MVDWKKPFEKIEIGKGRKLKDGKDIAILTIGHPGNFAQTAIRNLRTEDIDPAHYDMRFVKPLDENLLHEVFQRYDKIVTVEDGTIVGGLGTAVLEFMNAHGYKSQISILGIPDAIVEHGSIKELHHECHYDAAAIGDAVKTMLGKSVLIEA
jgi:1-deoxy-D-xylulose-5-phosphate synthase